MKKILFTIVALLLIAGCNQDVTGPATDSGTDATRTILFTVTGSMKECVYVTHTDATGGSTIIADCMVPFSVSVEVPAGATLQVTAGKRAEDGYITVMAIEDGMVLGYDTALEGDTEAQWREGM